MHAFTDNKGRPWAVELNVTAMKRARDLAGVNLARVLDDGFLEAFLEDAFQKADVLYAVCLDEARQRGVTDEDFGRGLTGDAMQAAEVALLQELANFSPARRPLIERITTRHQKMRAAADEKILEFLGNPEAEREILARVTKTLESYAAPRPGSISTAPPASPE